MVKLNQLSKTTTKKKKRIGRGYGSGVGGHTTIRGAKGMKARNKVPLTFDGSKIKKSWLKRLPFWKGKGRQRSLKNTIGIGLETLEKYFKKGEKVDYQSLVKKGLFSKTESNLNIKILGNGKLTKALTIIGLPCSAKAEEKINKAGGKISK